MAKNLIRILVTGANGQLAQCIRQFSVDFTYDFLFADRKMLDITDAEAVKKVFSNFEPHLVINTAAYTKVDLAETEIEAAYSINKYGVQNLVEACEQHSTKFIHISTDYVFSGKASKPYKITHKPAPNTIYGASKLAGERVVLNSKLEAFWIVRTSWLYSNVGENFYKTIQKLAQERDLLKVVDDQIGSPTRAEDLAYFLLRYLPHLNSKTRGIYHFSNSGTASWYDFAKAILNKYELKTHLTAVTSAEFPTAAVRPVYSVLDTSKIEENFGFFIRNWKDALG